MAYQTMNFKVPSKTASASNYALPQATGGMNTRYTADQIAQNQSPEMLNVNFNKGFPAQREGSNSFASLGASPIQGMQFYYNQGAGEWQLVVAWNRRIYLMDLTTGIATDVSGVDILGSATTKVNFFLFNSVLYFLDGSVLGYYDWNTSTAQAVADSATGAYVPTITLGRSPAGTTSTDNETLNTLSSYFIDSFSPDGTSTDFYLSYTGLSDIVSGQVILDGTAAVLNRDYTVDLTNGIVKFWVAPTLGTDTLTVMAKKTGITDKNNVLNCHIINLYGGDNDTRVFLSGNPNLPNYLWISGVTENGPDPTYYPTDGFIAVDNDVEKITGLVRLSDYQIVYKEQGQYYQTIDTSGTTTEFPVLPLNNEFGCVAPRSVVECNNGILALSKQGVTWTKLTTVRSQLAVDLVSLEVNKSSTGIVGITDNTVADMEAAHAVKWDEKYFLHVGNYTWVLDLRHSDFDSGIYCWYPYNGVFADVAQFAERETGQIYIGNGTSGIVSWLDSILYNDTGTAIDAYYTSPQIAADAPHWIKKFDAIFLTFHALTDASHTLTWTTATGTEDVTLSIETSTFPQNIREKGGYSEEYIQWKIRNNRAGEYLGIINQTLKYLLKKEVR